MTTTITPLDVDLSIPANVGEVTRFEPGQTPDRTLLTPRTLLVLHATEGLYRLLKWEEGKMAFSHLFKRERLTLTLEELVAKAPFSLLVLDRPWARLSTPKEGALYQVWPTGTLLRVQKKVFVDALSGQTLIGAAMHHKIPRLIPVLVERWVPSGGEASDGD
jgi:hypothetical protein